jgi:hypothetical protein
MLILIQNMVSGLEKKLEDVMMVMLDLLMENGLQETCISF